MAPGCWFAPVCPDCCRWNSLQILETQRTTALDPATICGCLKKRYRKTWWFIIFPIGMTILGKGTNPNNYHVFWMVLVMQPTISPSYPKYCWLTSNLHHAPQKLRSSSSAPPRKCCSGLWRIWRSRNFWRTTWREPGGDGRFGWDVQSLSA